MNLNKPLLLRHEALAQVVASMGGHADRGARFMDRDIQAKDGIAVVDLDGVLIERGDDWDVADSEGLSTAALAEKIESLKRRKDVRRVVLNLASPGGEVGGIQNAARAVASLRTAGIRTTAYVNSEACSGAYWIAAACDEIVLSSETSEVGSVGVVIAHREISKLEERLGVKTTEVAAGDQKRVYSHYEPLSEQGRKALEERAKEIHEIFKKEVMSLRPSLKSEDSGIWGTGRVFLGARAVEAGLADRIEYFPDIFRIGESDVDLEKLKADFPQVFAAAVQIGRDESVPDLAKARADAVAAERARVVGIIEIRIPGYEAAKAAAIKSGTTVEDFAVAIVQGRAERDRDTLPVAKENAMLEALRAESPRTRAGFENGGIGEDASVKAAVGFANRS